jgi:hypothetical protein
MLAMQYEITLPADYDMQIIRDRVATTGHLLDAYPGLGLKVFLIRERGVDGSTANQYAPFYLWADAAGAASFLWSGAGFTAILRDFGRPVVQTWIGGTAHQRSDWRNPPAYAVRQKTALAGDADLVGVARSADARLAEAVAAGETQLGAYGIDPRTWELVTVTLHEQRPEVPDAAELFQVLHAAAPERRQLPDRVESRLTVAR